MLLAIDIGNTNIVWGVFDGAKLLADWRVGTDHSKTTDEYAILLLDLLRVKEISPDRVAGGGPSSAAPPPTPPLRGRSRTHPPPPPPVGTPPPGPRPAPQTPQPPQHCPPPARHPA